jgi:hypothetical protein
MSDSNPSSKLEWYKSSYSESGNCVELARLPNRSLAVRDSKDRRGATLTFTPSEWCAFLAGVKDGEFDNL